MAVPAITLTCHLQDLFGNLNQGSIVFTLINPNDRTAPRIPGTSIIPAIQFEAASDPTGFISTLIWGNDAITPGPNGTFYCLTFKDADGGTIISVNYQFNGGGVQDLSQLAPFTGSATITPAPPNAVVTNPVGIQTIVGFPLSGFFIGKFIGSYGVNAVASGPTPQFDVSLGNLQKHTLNQNIVPTFVNLTESQPVWVSWTQDATGNRTVTFPGNVKDAEQPDPTPNRQSVQRFITIGTNLIADGGLTSVI